VGYTIFSPDLNSCGATIFLILGALGVTIFLIVFFTVFLTAFLVNFFVVLVFTAF